MVTQALGKKHFTPKQNLITKLFFLLFSVFLLHFTRVLSRCLSPHIQPPDVYCSSVGIYIYIDAK